MTSRFGFEINPVLDNLHVYVRELARPFKTQL